MATLTRNLYFISISVMSVVNSSINVKKRTNTYTDDIFWEWKSQNHFKIQ